jgi:ribulose-phosphate 3-epimerase
VVKALRPHSDLPFDVHLMISPVDSFLEAFRTAGADIISLHPEAGPHLHRSLKYIRSLGAKAGVVLNPATPIEVLDYIYDDLDLILVMSVNPGFGGQSFIDSQLRKVSAIRTKMDSMGHPGILQVDGGVNIHNAKACVDAGATALVAGTAVFKGGPTAYADNIAALKGIPETQ